MADTSLSVTDKLVDENSPVLVEFFRSVCGCSSKGADAARLVLGAAAPILSLRMWWLCIAWMLMGAAVTNLLVWTPLILEAALAGSFGGQATPAQHQALSLREQVPNACADVCA
jgi:hypothetical protein